MLSFYYMAELIINAVIFLCNFKENLHLKKAHRKSMY